MAAVLLASGEGGGLNATNVPKIEAHVSLYQVTQQLCSVIVQGFGLPLVGAFVHPYSPIYPPMQTPKWWYAAWKGDIAKYNEKTWGNFLEKAASLDCQ